MHVVLIHKAEGFSGKTFHSEQPFKRQVRLLQWGLPDQTERVAVEVEAEAVPEVADEQLGRSAPEVKTSPVLREALQSLLLLIYLYLRVLLAALELLVQAG
jgi:hypothetical protein